MDNHKQVINLCGFCGKKQVYNEYHRIYNPCRICVVNNSAPYYQVNRDKKLQDLYYNKITQRMYESLIRNKKKSLIRK